MFTHSNLHASLLHNEHESPSKNESYGLLFLDILKCYSWRTSSFVLHSLVLDRFLLFFRVFPNWLNTKCFYLFIHIYFPFFHRREEADQRNTDLLYYATTWHETSWDILCKSENTDALNFIYFFCICLIFKYSACLVGCQRIIWN